MSSYSIAVSGLAAQSAKVAGHAQNIVNAGVTGKPHSKPGARIAYQPVDVVSISREGGGVSTQVVPRDPGTSLVYAPDSADSDENGNVAVPDVSLEEEIVGLSTAKNAYAADAKIISVQRQMDKDLLDIIT